MTESKTKKLINVFELIILGLIFWAIIGTYLTANSFSRFTVRNQFLKLSFDLILIFLLIFRFTKIRLNFNRSFQELKELELIEKIAYGLCIIFLLPDLLNWYQWYYFVNVYLDIFLVFLALILFWTIEIIERSSNQNNKWRNYVLGVFGFISPVVIISIYLNQVV